MTEPLLTKSLFLDYNIVTKCILHPKAIDDILPKIKQFSCHNQASERCVKLITEDSSSVCGPLRHDGYIKTRLEFIVSLLWQLLDSSQKIKIQIENPE